MKGVPSPSATFEAKKMVSHAILSAVFNTNCEAQALAQTYAITAQQDTGLEWIARQSRRIAKCVAYLTVHQDTEVACLTLNGGIRTINRSLEERINFQNGDEDYVDVDTVIGLRHVLENDLEGEDRIIEAIMDQITSETGSADSVHLKPICELLA